MYNIIFPSFHWIFCNIYKTLFYLFTFSMFEFRKKKLVPNDDERWQKALLAFDFFSNERSVHIKEANFTVFRNLKNIFGCCSLQKFLFTDHPTYELINLIPMKFNVPNLSFLTETVNLFLTSLIFSIASHVKSRNIVIELEILKYWLELRGTRFSD